MKRKKLLGILATLTICGAVVVSYPENSFAIYLGDYNGENLGQKLIDEGKTAYVDGIFQEEVKKQNHEMTSNKLGTEYTFTFDVPTWTSVSAARGEWIERLAGNGQTVTGPGTGVPGYDKIYYGDGPNYSGKFEITGLAVTTTDSTIADLEVSSAVNKPDHKVSVTTKVKLKKDIDIKEIPLSYTATGITMGTQVVDSQNSSQYNIPLEVKDIDLANSKTKATLDLGTVNVAVKADTITSSSTTPSTSTSSSSSTTPSTSTSSSSSTTPSTSTSSSSSTTPSTSTSSSSNTSASSSGMSTDPSTSTSSSVTTAQAKTPVLYTASGSSSSSSSSTMPTSSTSAKISSTASASTLPKTGEKQSIWITLMGIVLLGASMFYLKKNKVKNK
ncbi:LPXTG cell wall anchor domain-containing protein [Enterococcus sp. VV15]|uniref:LPXTG cell wall anchor domain-containing protein n=1 Tax=Enterococcus sp. VV15 TaxID=2233541 RepID=UPI0010C1BEA7|nr:LPXTG cell wall anchor domain-containing protein [Enterococcus sp. VV15]TKN16024.1 LPXTG cell wall anchor domain-containing protein [Enterococcus sp. VV15]